MTQLESSAVSEEAPAATATTKHQALFVRSASYPQLLSVVCSCGRSSFGASGQDSASMGHDRHVANPTNGDYREPDVTLQLFGPAIVAQAAHPSTPPNTIKERSA